MTASILLACRFLRSALFAQGFSSNPLVFISIGILLMLQVCFTYLSPLQTLFTSAPLDRRSRIFAMTVGAIVLQIISLDKWIRNCRSADASTHTREIR